ncbi:MAG: hypothetical protein IJV15_00050 [Lachnospiraceae bacterium]|nr:hypothetical protein [Lachnospiraceae bacterium]
MMNKDRIIELTEIINNPDLHGYLPNVCNELLQVNIELQKKAELGEHYKHLYSEVKKQKDDVVEYIKYQLSNLDLEKDEDAKAKMLGSMILVMLEDNRMLGEIDVED